MTDFFLTLIGAALANNLVLLLPLGIDPALGAPGPRSRLHALGLATACVLLLAMPLSQVLYQQLLLPLHLEHLRLLGFLLLGALLILPTLALLARVRPGLPVAGLEPLILLNGALLGLALLAGDAGFFQALALGLGGGLGFWLVLLLFADLLERIDQPDLPAAFRGAPILLISAGLMGLAFLGFAGLDRP